MKIQGQDLYFPPLIGNEWETISPSSLGWCEDELPVLQTWLEDRNTKAFIILKDGKIAVEWYYDSFTQDSVWYWASAGKTMTAFLTGVAQEKGYLDIDDKTSDYLGEGWTSATLDKENLITIKHQLSMSSGLNDSPDANCTDPICLQYLEDAGNRWAYHNGPYTLLSSVVESAISPDYSGNYNNFTFSELTLKAGITGAWSYVDDSRIFFSKARSMARFGLLNLNEGTWDNDPILTDANYFNDMITPSQEINKSYGYLWWLNGQESHMLPTLQSQFNEEITPNAPSDMYAAMGKNGQLINIVPSQNLVVVRMGDDPDDSLVPTTFQNNLWEKLNAVICNSTSVNELTVENIKLFPNPATEIIHIQASSEISQIEVFSINGKSVLRVENENNIRINHLSKGLYFARIMTKNGVAVLDFVVE